MKKGYLKVYNLIKFVVFSPERVKTFKFYRISINFYFTSKENAPIWSSLVSQWRARNLSMLKLSHGFIAALVWVFAHRRRWVWGKDKSNFVCLFCFVSCMLHFRLIPINQINQIAWMIYPNNTIIWQNGEPLKWCDKLFINHNPLQCPANYY